MAQDIYFGVSSVARTVSKPYFGVNGVARNVSNGYIGVSGVARAFLETATWERYSVASGYKVKSAKIDLSNGGTYTTETHKGSGYGYFHYSDSYTFDKTNGHYNLSGSITSKRISSTGREYTIPNRAYTIVNYDYDTMYQIPMLNSHKVDVITKGTPNALRLYFRNNDDDVQVYGYKYTTTAANIKGTLIDTITAPAGTYPDDGEQDGYWYVKV